ncbi:hypothetical protein ACP70R_028651 [Stipagrostis hirtigluma subsp. patula]
MASGRKAVGVVALVVITVVLLQLTAAPTAMAARSVPDLASKLGITQRLGDCIELCVLGVCGTPGCTCHYPLCKAG